jgi:hypothetical protein
MKLSKFFVICFFSLTNITFGQDLKWDRTFELFVSPSISTRVLGTITPDIEGGFTLNKLTDSFAKADVSSNFVNFGANFVYRKTERKAFSVGISYLKTGFTRQKEGNMFNYLPHPDLQVYANLSEGPTQILNYQFNYSYLTLDLRYLRRIDGAGLMIKGTKIWYFFGVAPSLLLNSNVTIMTQGFTLVEGNNISTYDYTVVHNANGKYSNDKGRFDTKRVYPSKVNLLVNAGVRFDYALSETMHLLLQPKINIPLLPSAGGVQVAWCPQASLDIGVIWPLH